MKQTAIQLLKESIDYEIKLGTKMVVNWDWYLEMEREQIKNAFETGDFENTKVYTAQQYYNETYVDK